MLTPRLRRSLYTVFALMNARTSEISTFSKLARENFRSFVAVEQQAEELRRQLAKVDPDYDHDIREELFTSEEKMDKFMVVVIVFSVIAIEAYIYDYAARHFSDSFVKNYIDKLDLISKWVIVPRFVTVKGLPREHKWFELIKDLVRERNSIVHSKSSQLPGRPEMAKSFIAKLQKENIQRFQSTRQAIQLLDELIIEMSSLDAEEAFWINSSLGNNNQNLMEEP